MSYLERVTSGVGGDRVISFLGVLYVALAVGWTLWELSGGVPFGDVLIKAIFVGTPGLVLLYWGNRLTRSDVQPELYSTVAVWCLWGIAAMLGLLALYHVQPGDGIDDPVESVLILTALASVAGLGVGIHDARAKTRAREAERHGRELERQNERLESFAGMLAHELRNPLTIAQIYHPQEQPQNGDAAQQVERALGRIEEMIDVLLITARGPNASVDPEPVALADVAADAWADASTQLAAKAAGDSTQTADDPTQTTDDPAQTADLDAATEQTIMADPVHVEHLLRNLFRNSFEHGDDAVTVRVGDLPVVSASSEGLRPSDRSSGQSPREDDASGGSTDSSVGGFYVADDGPGIPEDVREEVVEAGFTTKTDGIGLGLTFVAQLAEMYDWDYSISESETGGARFEFTNVDLASTPEELQRH